MTQIQTDAIKKISDDKSTFKSRAHEYVKPFVARALCTFIEQSPAFAETVMAEGKNLHDCVESIKITERHHSDIEVYETAVRYFFPEARIESKMQVIMPKSQAAAKILELNFEDLFGGI